MKISFASGRLRGRSIVNASVNDLRCQVAISLLIFSPENLLKKCANKNPSKSHNDGSRNKRNYGRIGITHDENDGQQYGRFGGERQLGSTGSS